jgi:hypothetical protein
LIIFLKYPTLNNLVNISNQFSSTENRPALFLVHVSPMNAIEENEFVEGLGRCQNITQTKCYILYLGSLVYKRYNGNSHANA